MQNVDDDPACGRQFWGRLGRAVTHYMSSTIGHVNRVVDFKVAPMLSQSNARVLRGYFTPINNHLESCDIIYPW